MLCRKSYCCSLLRFVALFVLFSILLGVDVKALDNVGDYAVIEDSELMILSDGAYSSDDVSISYYMARRSDGYYFSGSNTKAFAEDWAYPNIWLITSISIPDTIAPGQAFDLALSTSISGISSYGEFIVILYDTNWKALVQWSSSISDKLEINYFSDLYRYYCSNLSIDKAVKHIRILQAVDISVPCDVAFSNERFDLAPVSDSGKLSNILDTIRNIFTSITNLPANIANSIKGFFDNVVNAVNKVFTAISELPAKIWNLIETGLKNLFVPTQEDLQEYHDKWDMLFADRFGALYEVVEIVKNFIGSFESYNETGTIDFPAVTVDLAGSPFTFGGWSVPIVPSGLEFLFDAVKLAIDMVATYAFVFGLKRRYEELVERG